MLRLPERAGPRPATSTQLPHRQLDQNSPPAVYEAMLARLGQVEGAEQGASTISVPGARALFRPACGPCNLRFGFIRGREFAHLHPQSDGSLHLALAPDDLQAVFAAGWGEFHPWVPSGRVLPNIAMVYAPRDLQEVEVAMRIVEASLRNACGDAA